MNWMTGARQDVVVKIYGEDLGKLSGYAARIGAIARKISGAEDVLCRTGIRFAAGCRQI